MRSHTTISLIAAVADNGVIGLGGDLPWRLPADLKRFKKLTMGKPMIMGRKTWESIGKALPGRVSIVVSRDPEYRAVGGVVATSIVEALVEANDSDDVMVIGGAALYEALLPRADVMYLTAVHAEPQGDASFPDWNPEEWEETSREEHPSDDINPHAYTFRILKRIERRRPGVVR